MDTSEEYIKMCACPEIQLNKKIQLGDYIALRGTDIASVCVHRGLPNHIYGIDVPNPNEWIKLFRQDQIQEMMKFEDICECNYMFHEFSKLIYQTELWGKAKVTFGAEECFDSMEQLWLAFYMHEKHGKIWGGEKWVKKQTK